MSWVSLAFVATLGASHATGTIKGNFWHPFQRNSSWRTGTGAVAPTKTDRSFGRKNGLSRLIDRLFSDSHGGPINDDNEVSEDDDDARLQLMQLALTQAVPQALKTFVELGIPDILNENGAADAADKGMSISELAEAIKIGRPKSTTIHQDALLILLRILGTVGVVQEWVEPPRQAKFRLTTLGRLLQSNKSGSSNFDPMVRYFLDDPIWKAWGYLPSSIVQEGNQDNNTRQTPFEMANGIPSHQYYGMSEHANSLSHANRFVQFVSEEEARVCVDGFDWETFSSGKKKTVVDLGGHEGKVMQAVATKHPLLRCICLDLPNVVSRASSSKNSESASKVELVGGDMFDYTTIPPCDAIFMKHIVLCDWDEGKSRAIMHSCYKVLPPNGLVIIGESVLPDPGSTESNGTLSLYVDCFMMLGGRDSSRTVQEWERFAEETGFRLLSIRYTSIPTCSIIVLQKASPTGTNKK